MFEPAARFLASLAWKEQADSSVRRQPRPFVTISRQAGAGGRRLAEAIVRALESEKGAPPPSGWQVFDQELCTNVTDDPKLKVLLANLLDERYHSEAEDYISQLLLRTSPQRQVLGRVFETVRKLAMAGKAVLVGRAGVVITRDLPCGVHVRLVAGPDTRVQSVMRRFGLTAVGTEKEIAELDRRRSALFKDYFNKDIDDPLLYDAVFNADSLSLEAIATLVVEMVKRRIVECQGLALMEQTG
jgi:cytidylate kinase